MGVCKACLIPFRDGEPKYNEEIQDFEELCNVCLRAALTAAYPDEILEQTTLEDIGYNPTKEETYD